MRMDVYAMALVTLVDVLRSGMPRSSDTFCGHLRRNQGVDSSSFEDSDLMGGFSLYSLVMRINSVCTSFVVVCVQELMAALLWHS